MRNIWTRFESARVAFVKSLAWFSDHPQQRITRSMIVTELERWEIDRQSLCVMITTKASGAARLITSLFTKSR